MPSNKIEFEIINQLGVIAEQSKGWKMEFNRISWNLAEPKYDIRSWSDNHEKMGKGITLTEQELRNLGKLINEEIAYLDGTTK